MPCRSMLLKLSFSFAFLCTSSAWADWNPDYCPALRKDFKSTSAGIESGLNATLAQYEGWNRNPETLPGGLVTRYRLIVRLAAYTEWAKTATGQELAKAWRELDPSADLKKKFFDEVYKKDVSAEQEKMLARELFQVDYTDNIKPQLDSEADSIRQRLKDKRDGLDKECSPDVLSQIFRGTIGRSILTYDRNKAAAEYEKGDLANQVRRWTGISLTDISKHGLRGGENSELAKLHKTWTDALDRAGVGENHFLREVGRQIDPTNMDVPDELQITIDKDSLSNFEKNVNPLRW